MVFVKKFFFFLLMPIYVPASLLINSTYDWWLEQKDSNKFIFFLLAPIYGPLSLFLLWSFGWWVSLSE